MENVANVLAYGQTALCALGPCTRAMISFQFLLKLRVTGCSKLICAQFVPCC